MCLNFLVSATTELFDDKESSVLSTLDAEEEKVASIHICIIFITTMYFLMKRLMKLNCSELIVCKRLLTLVEL